MPKHQLSFGGSGIWYPCLACIHERWYIQETSHPIHPSLLRKQSVCSTPRIQCWSRTLPRQHECKRESNLRDGGCTPRKNIIYWKNNIWNLGDNSNIQNMFFGWKIAILTWQLSFSIDASFKHGWSFHSSSCPQCSQNWDIEDRVRCPVIDFANWKGWIDIHNIFRVLPVNSKILQKKPHILYSVLGITCPPHCVQNLMGQEHRYEAMILSMPARNLVTRGWSLAWCLLLVIWCETTWMLNVLAVEQSTISWEVYYVLLCNNIVLDPCVKTPFSTSILA